MSQTVIQKYGYPVAVAGQLSDNMEGVDVVSRFNQDVVQLPFGTAVKAGTAERSAKALAANTDIVQGFVKWGTDHFPANASGSIGDVGATGLLPNAGLEIVRRGRMYCVVDPSIVTITPYSDRCFIRCTVNGGNNVIGAVSNVADGANNIDCTKQAQFVSGIFTAADGVTKIAEVEVSFNNKP